MNNTLVVGVRVRALLNWQSLIDSKVENETNRGPYRQYGNFLCNQYSTDRITESI